MREIAITIKPTLACNMHCIHCFNGNNMENTTCLDVQTAIKLIEIASCEYEVIKVTFHGGEPSIMGYGFFRRFYDAEKKIHLEKGILFSNYFTTNGLLLDIPFIELLKEFNVMINISFDGPFNDVLRNNTEAVYQNILLAKKMNAKMRVFCTLSSQSIHNLIEIYEWFNSRGIDFKIAPLEPWGYAANLKELLINPTEYIEELMSAYKYWIKDKNCKIKFNTFEEFINLKRGLQFKPFWFNREIALNPDGNLYPFGRPNDINYCLGSPYKLSNLSSAFLTDRYESLLKILNNNREKRCSVCPSIDVCNGVIENMTYMYVSDEQLIDDRCKTANNLFQNAIAINEKIMIDLRNGHSNLYNPVVVKYLLNEKERGCEEKL